MKTHGAHRPPPRPRAAGLGSPSSTPAELVSRPRSLCSIQWPFFLDPSFSGMLQGELREGVETIKLRPPSSSHLSFP